MFTTSNFIIREDRENLVLVISADGLPRAHVSRFKTTNPSIGVHFGAQMRQDARQ